MADCDVIKFPAVDLNIREDGAAQVARKVFDAFVQTELQAMSVFQGVSQRQLKQLAPLLSLEEHPSGSKLFSIGSPGDKVFIMMHGAVSIYKGKTRLSQLHAEQGQAASSSLGLPIFGEMALIDRKPRVVSVVCDMDCKLLVLPVDQFAAAMFILPDLKARLRRMKEQRRTESEELERKRKMAAANADSAAASAAKPAEDDGLDVDM